MPSVVAGYWDKVKNCQIASIFGDPDYSGQRWQHLRYTARLLVKSPGFTITAILILGFGIGVNTAIFSLINAVLLKPLPFSQPDRLVRIERANG
jgi:hypothetical protein